MKAYVLASLVILSVISASLNFAAEPQDEKNASFWMKKKLEYSEKILGGLATEDYDTIAKTARSMKTLTQMEKWVRGSTKLYLIINAYVV